MKQKRKRLFAALLSAAMCLSLLTGVPVTVQADETATTTETATDGAETPADGHVASATIDNATKYYTTVQAAANAIVNSTSKTGKITLLQNVTATSNVLKLNTSGVNITLDLTDKSITKTNKDTGYTITVQNGSALTIIGSGSITNESSVIRANTNGTLIIGEKDSAIAPTVTQTNTNAVNVSAIKGDEQSNITIYGGTFEDKRTNQARSLQSYGTTTIYGGTFNARVQAWSYMDYSSELTIYGGTFKDRVDTVCDSNDTITSNDKNNDYGNRLNMSIKIYGGTFEDELKNNLNDTTAGTFTNKKNQTVTINKDNSSITIYGGTFSKWSAISEGKGLTVPTGYVAVGDSSATIWKLGDSAAATEDSLNKESATVGYTIPLLYYNDTTSDEVYSNTITVTASAITAPTCTTAGTTVWKGTANVGGQDYTITYNETVAAAHTLTHVEAKAATTTATGNTEYWKCSVCGKYFSDAAGTKETTEAAVTIAKKTSSSGGGGSNSSGGGSSSGGSTSSNSSTSDTKTETKADGTKVETTTTTKTDGTKTETVTETKTDGTKTETVTETKTDGTKTETVTETKTDGTKSESVTVTKADGSKTETATVTNTDGSSKTTVTETNASGAVTKSTETTVAADKSKTEKVTETTTNSANNAATVITTTKTDASGAVTSKTQRTEIAQAAENTSVAVSVKTDAAGEVTSAKATAAVTASGNKAKLSASVVSQIAEAAGSKASSVAVTLKVSDTNGNVKYKVKVESEDLAPGNELYIFKMNTETGELVMVNAKEYSVSDAGTLSISIKNSGTYKLVSAEESAKITKEIKATIQPQKKTTSVAKGKKVSFKLKSTVNKSNIKSITYSTTNKSVATVNKNGKITAKKAGTVTVKAKVTLKNGAVKTIKMKVKVK